MASGSAQHPEPARHRAGADQPSSRLRCGVFVLAGRYPGQDDGAALRRSLAVVEAAERAGFDDAWIAEHHFMSYGVCPSALTFAAHALGRTRRISVGTAVSILSNQHPVALAEQVALLDQLSGGRFRLGLGRGGPWVDLEVFGTGLDRYEQGFPESLELLMDCLTRERVSRGGAGATDASSFRFQEVAIVPRPLTRPHPPVVVACTSPRTAELAASRGLPMLLGMDLDDDARAEIVAHHAKAADVAGHDPDGMEHVAAALVHVADDRDQALRELRDTVPGWLVPGLAGYVRIDGRAGERRDPYRHAERLCRVGAIGDPDDCAARLRASAEATGIRHVIMMVEATGDHDRTLDTVARLGAEVLPRL